MEDYITIILFTLLSILLSYLILKLKLCKNLIFPLKKKFNLPFPFTIITEYKELMDLLHIIYNQKIKMIGLDVEYYQGDEYEGRICLFQITLSNKATFIIDVIILGSYRTKEFLRRILEDEQIEKIIHACDTDIKWIHKEYNIKVLNIFDTQEASRLLNKNTSKEGLDVVLKRYSLFEMDRHNKKVMQKSNWKKRPLTDEQLIYSAQDSYYLIDLRDVLALKLGENLFKFKENSNKNFKERLMESWEEKCNLKALNFFISNCVKMNPLVHEVSKEVFISLYRFNDNLSKKINCNSSKLLNSKLLMKISNKLPNNTQELTEIFRMENVKYLPEKYNDILTIIQKIKTDKVNSLTDHEIEYTEYNSVRENLANQTICKNRDVNSILKSYTDKPAYDNCKMLDPDGKLLCFVDAKKMKWYIGRNIAEKVNSETNAFRLKFEPGGRGCSELAGISAEFSKDRKNCCVVCGSEKEFIKFHVVPSLYRTFFSKDMKEHRSHDVLLLCSTCMIKANKAYDQNIKNLSKEYNVPIKVLSDKQKDIQRLENVKIAAKKIYNNFDMPNEKKIEIGKELVDFVNHPENKIKYPFFFAEVILDEEILSREISYFSKDLLGKIKSYKIKEESSEDKKNYHGKLVVDQIRNFNEFIRRWRLYFIKSMDPQYLPDAWKVDNMHYLSHGEHTYYTNQIYDDQNN